MPGFGSISAPHLARLIGAPERPVRVDLRSDDDVAGKFGATPVGIAGVRSGRDGHEDRHGRPAGRKA